MVSEDAVLKHITKLNEEQTQKYTEEGKQMYIDRDAYHPLSTSSFLQVREACNAQSIQFTVRHLTRTEFLWK